MEPQELLHFVVVLVVEQVVCLKNYHVRMVLEKFVVVGLNCLTI